MPYNKTSELPDTVKTSLDRLAAKLSYNWLFDVMPLPSIYQGHAPDKFEPYYKPHQAFVH